MNDNTGEILDGVHLLVFNTKEHFLTIAPTPTTFLPQVRASSGLALTVSLLTVSLIT